MRTDQLPPLIDAWTERGWLRPLDRAFMRFLQSLDPAAENLCLLAATLASHQLGRGHICLDLAATLAAPDEALSLPPEGESEYYRPPLPSTALAGLTVGAFQAALDRSALVGNGAGPAPLVLDGERLYLRRYWEYERQVGESIRARLAHAAEVPDDLAARLNQLFPGQSSPGAGETVEPDWQKIACAMAAGGFFTVITGGPGTGKTTTVVRLLALLQSAARQRGPALRIRLAAPTGKAAARLTESIGNAVNRLPESMREAIPTEASTLHRLLGARPDTRHFRHHPGNPLHADLVVIDEASMIDLEIMAALLAALRPETRLVLLGDKDQLASVEAGSVLGDLCQDADRPGYQPDTVAWLSAVTGEDLSGHAGPGGALAQRIVSLRVSHRFTAGSGIGQLSRAVNAGDGVETATILSRQPPDLARVALTEQDGRALERLALDGGREHFARGPVDANAAAPSPLPSPPQGYRLYLETLRQGRPSLDASREAHEAWADAVLDAFDQFQLLCALRRGDYGVEGLNRRIAEALHRAGLIGQTQGWYEGRPVLVTRNDYSLGLMNGDIGIALRLPDFSGAADSGPARLRVAFRQPDRSIKSVLPSRLTEIETVYAMTVHKSQGSEFTHVALVLPDRPNPILTRELIYTGLTRAKTWLSLLLPDEGILPQAIARRVHRSGRLGEICG
ncbi:exodeoxyribonuclease V subunit alpha [Methylomagnum sp.]